MDVHEAKSGGHFFLDPQWLANDGLGKHSSFLGGWWPNDAASFGHQVDIRKHLSQPHRQGADKASKFLLQSALDEAQQVLVVALTSEKLKDLHDPLLQLLGQPHLLLILSAVIGVPGYDCDEVVLLLVLGLVEGEAGEVLKLLDALLHLHRVEFYYFVEVGDRQHAVYHQFLF